MFLLHLKLALAGLRIANEEEPKVDFDGYFCLLYSNILSIFVDLQTHFCLIQWAGLKGRWNGVLILCLLYIIENLVTSLM